MHHESEHVTVANVRGATVQRVNDPRSPDLIGRLIRAIGPSDDPTLRRVSCPIWASRTRRQLRIGDPTLETRLSDKLYLVTPESERKTAGAYFSGQELSEAVRAFFEAFPDAAQYAGGV